MPKTADTIRGKTDSLAGVADTIAWTLSATDWTRQKASDSLPADADTINVSLQKDYEASPEVA